jgi:hypothetical protein
MNASRILFHSYLSWATGIHLTPHILLNSSAHILSDTIPVFLASICHPFFSLCVMHIVTYWHIVSNSCLSWAICIHLTRHILLNSSAHRLLGLPCFHILSDTIPVLHTSVHLPSILLAMCPIQLFHTFCYICHFGHTSYPCIPLTISSQNIILTKVLQVNGQNRQENGFCPVWRRRCVTKRQGPLAW